MSYECIIVGSWPAGLSSAIHLAWHNRKTLEVYRKTGPLFFTLEKLYNVLGMPETKGIDIQKNLRQQKALVQRRYKTVTSEIGAFELKSLIPGWF